VFLDQGSKPFDPLAISCEISSIKTTETLASLSGSNKHNHHDPPPTMPKLDPSCYIQYVSNLCHPDSAEYWDNLDILYLNHCCYIAAIQSGTAKHGKFCVAWSGTSGAK
jgi:hypothetical protein